MTRDVQDPGEAFLSEDMWEGMVDPATGLIYEPPDDETAVAPRERQSLDIDEFWDSRPVLRHLHTYARARRVGPWAVLGATLARVIAQCSPQIQLPPTIGSYASLNLFVGLVGYSGDGKDAAVAVAGEAVHFGGPPKFKVAPLGSGEGLAHMFMRQRRITAEERRNGETADVEQYNRHALVTIPEIDTLGALVQRQSSTVTSQLRQAAMGQPLGFHYADAAKRMIVPEHQYRLCLLAGIQPERSAVLLNESAGGTPQRFVWLPAGDPGAQIQVPDCPDPLRWIEPNWNDATRVTFLDDMRWVVGQPDIVKETIIRARVAQQRHESDALDSHAILTRTKVAAAFAFLDGRPNIAEDDWSLSGVVMTVSDTQRAVCQRALVKEREKATVAKAMEQATITTVVEERLDETKVKKCSASIVNQLSNRGPLTGSELRRWLKSTQRDYMDAALDALSIAGVVEGTKIEHRGQSGVRYQIRRT
jgi:hypothetical protein